MEIMIILSVLGLIIILFASFFLLYYFSSTLMKQAKENNRSTELVLLSLPEKYFGLRKIIPKKDRSNRTLIENSKIFLVGKYNGRSVYVEFEKFTGRKAQSEINFNMTHYVKYPYKFVITEDYIQGIDDDRPEEPSDQKLFGNKVLKEFQRQISVHISDFHCVDNFEIDGVSIKFNVARLSKIENIKMILTMMDLACGMLEKYFPRLSEEDIPASIEFPIVDKYKTIARFEPDRILVIDKLKSKQTIYKYSEILSVSATDFPQEADADIPCIKVQLGLFDVFLIPTKNEEDRTSIRALLFQRMNKFKGSSL